MFEYLMGALLLPSYPGSTLSAAQHACVRAQQKHGREGVFGVSESGYAQYDQELNYRYQAFGLRELALDSRCEGDVIAPYAAALALRCAPQAACEALLRMQQRGWYGDQGFYEAADFTAGAQETLVYSHMAHHQGMILCGTFGKPEDVAGAVAFLVSEDAGYITGQVIHVDGGMC